MLLICILIYCVLVVLGGIVAMAETSMLSLSPGQIYEMARDPRPKAQQVAKMVCKPRELLVSLLCFNILVNILVQNVASSTFTEDANLWIQVGIPFLTTFFVSDVLPRVLALRYNLRTSLALAPWVSFITRCLMPVIPLFTVVSGWVSQRLFFFVRTRPPIDGRKLLKALEMVSEHGDMIDPQEKKLMRGLIELQSSKAQDIMWPRTEILYYNIDEPIDKLYKLINSEECGKIPVCQMGLDQILGILYVKDLLALPEKTLDPDIIRQCLRKALFVPESMPAVRLLRQLDDAYQSMAIVVDEYGNVSGVLTREDLLEVVIGEIIDRRDHKNRYIVTPDGSILASGKWELSQLESLLGLELANPHKRQTLGGWLCSVSGNIPLPGHRWVFDRYIFEVMTSTPTHVRKVLIRKVAISGELNAIV